MKRLLATLFAAMIPLAASSPVSAQVYGQFAGAEALPMNGHLFGGYLHASEDFVGLLAQLRLSFYPNVDFGFHGGLTRAQVVSGNDITTLRVGGDFKCQVVKSGRMDLAIGAALGVETGNDINLLTLGPALVASRAFAGSSGAGIVPYAGVGLLFTNADAQGRESTDFAVPFRFGAEFRLAPEVRLIGEIQLRASDRLNDGFSFVTGINLPF